MAFIKATKIIKRIDGFDDYSVTVNGRVISYKNNKIRFKSPHPNQHGHLKVHLYKNNIDHKKYIHQLVLNAFVGLCPDGMECCHENGDPGNNNLSNLRWDTKLSNEADKKKHGTVLYGLKNHSTKLSTEQIAQIKNLKGAMFQREIAKTFNISQSHVSNIHNGYRRIYG